MAVAPVPDLQLRERKTDAEYTALWEALSEEDKVELDFEDHIRFPRAGNDFGWYVAHADVEHGEGGFAPDQDVIEPFLYETAVPVKWKHGHLRSDRMVSYHGFTTGYRMITNVECDYHLMSNELTYLQLEKENDGDEIVSTYSFRPIGAIPDLMAVFNEFTIQSTPHQPVDWAQATGIFETVWTPTMLTPENTGDLTTVLDAGRYMRIKLGIAGVYDVQA